jgi:hypothetical protein
VWPVQGGKNQYIDYHGYFNAEKFECLFDTICHVVQPYGSCVIHMDGAFYRKRRINPYFGALSIMKHIATKYKYALFDTFKALKIHFIHVHGKK